MSTAAAPMNARNRLILEFGLKIFAPACFAAAGIGLVMLYIVNAIFAEANSLDKEYTRRAAGAAVQAVQQRMENVARDNALWDDAIRNSYEPFNEPWAYEAWGVGTELGLYNMAFIVNAEGKTIFSYENGKKMDKPIAAVFGNGLIRLVARLPQDKTTFATVSALFKRNKELYAVSAAPILPSSDAVSLPQERPNNLIFAKLIDGEMLATLAQQHVLDGLSFDREDKLSGDTLSLTDYDGETIGALTWTSRRPGDIARLKYDDIIKIMIGTILAVMGTLVYFSWRNFEEANASKQNALESSLRDELTGLANRRKIISELTETLERHPGPVGGLSIIYADLDGFKNVNDTHGHEAGDELLRAAANGFRRIVGDRGMVARVGGDEFAIIVQTPDAAAAAREIAAAMIELLSVPMTFANHVASLGVSIGLVDSFDGPADAEEMLRRADIAMYVAKSGGRHRACVFAPQMDFDPR